MNLFDFDLFIFDCDGVILDSNNIKTEAFKKAVANYSSDEIEKFAEFKKNNAGVSRFEIFEYFLTNITTNPKDTADDLLNIFQDICVNDLINSNLVEGVEEFLQKLNDAGKVCYVNSGGAENELHTIFEKKGLGKYFKTILGSPNNKQQNMEKILAELGQEKFINTVFFGDAKSDIETAINNDCEIVFISGHSDYKDWKSDQRIKIKFNDFSDLHKNL